ncbi:LysR family transcriptional regulator [Escherichia coli]
MRSGSIGSAAKELGLTQPAVSKIINDIEDYFGVELVVRKKYRCNINTCRSIVTLPFRIHYP